MTGFNPIGPRAYTRDTAAIVRPAEVKNCEFYESKLSQCTSDYDMWLDEFKASGTWREKYKTWEACCEIHLGASQQAVDKRIAKHKAKTTQVVSGPDKTTNQEQKSLSQVESAREEPEKPRVKTAPESIADNKDKKEADQVPVECPKCHGSGWIGQNPKVVADPCKCGCDLTVQVCQTLFEYGIPSIGLTKGQAGLLMGKLAENNWELPRAFEFAKNEGEWIQRKFRGKEKSK